MIFRRLREHPGWNVHRGYKSFVTFEFGRPHLENRGIIDGRDRKRLPLRTRSVYVRGDWHLWIYCCDWAVTQDGKPIARSSSSNDDIDRACACLCGQKILGITVVPETGKTVFSFDLGGVMLTQPMAGEVIEQWSLRCPGEKVFLFRSDGYFAFSKCDLPYNEHVFLPANAKVVHVGLLSRFQRAKKKGR